MEKYTQQVNKLIAKLHMQVNVKCTPNGNYVAKIAQELPIFYPLV